MPSRAQKILDLGLARDLPDLTADDLVDDSLDLANINVSVSNLPTIRNSSVDIDVTNNLSQQVNNEVLTVQADGVRVGSKLVDIAANSTKTVTINFKFNKKGSQTVAVNGGDEKIATTVDVGLI
jgi:hypothetical protein